MNLSIFQKILAGVILPLLIFFTFLLAISGGGGYVTAFILLPLSLCLPLFFARRIARAVDEMSTRNEELEKDLQSTKDRLSDQLAFQTALLDTIPNPISIKDTDGRYITVNVSFEETFGVHRDRLKGMNFLDIDYYDQETREKLYAEDMRVLKAVGIEREETNIPFQDGKQHDVLYWKTAFSLASGTPAGILSVVVDITEEKILKKKIEVAKKRLQTITDAIPGAVYQFYSDTERRFHFTFMSDGLSDLMAVSRKDALRSFRNVFRRMHPDDRGEFYHLHAKETKRLEVRHCFFKNSERRVLQCHIPITNACCGFVRPINGRLEFVGTS